SCLFSELYRLGILEAEFFIDDNRITEKKKLRADPAIRARFFQAIEDAQSRALSTLTANSDDRNALFTMCLTSGLVLDYSALVEKKQLTSLSHAKRSNLYAQRLLKLDPQFYDAYMTTGFSEYLVASLPFFIRWFVRFDEVRGSKEQGIENLRLVAQSGRYLKPFAKFLLSIAYLREKKPQESERILAELTREYPENPLVRKELAKVSTWRRSGQFGAR
ncbi:MAG: hypothetical protein HY236_04330, partial [Acidobacteria bacterium]|nr:hypothetical protein [Acidobacteriota bacterium]